MHGRRYNLKNTIRDEKVADKLSAEDKARIRQAVDDAIAWLDANQARSLCALLRQPLLLCV